MRSWIRTGIKWTLISIVILVAGIGFLSWRDSHRTEAWSSCYIQAQDQETIRLAKSSKYDKDEAQASTNLFIDACMKERGHLFVAGMRECSTRRTPGCYSLL
jgi:hypothetical protein